VRVCEMMADESQICGRHRAPLGLAPAPPDLSDEELSVGGTTPPPPASPADDDASGDDDVGGVDVGGIKDEMVRTRFYGY